MKRLCLLLTVLLVSMSAFCVSLGTYHSENASLDMLATHFSIQEMDDSEREFWENTVISLVTITKGDAVYEWFGHSAISVAAPGNESITYNYGYFSFSDGFYANFAMGRLLYLCDANYTKYEIMNASYFNRTLTETPLNLTPEQKKAVVQYLSYNSTPPNNTYLYHYYADNCATRIRDIIDYATEGQFSAWAKGVKGLSYRKNNSRILANNLFWNWLLDFLEGDYLDNQDATLWEEMYLPQKLQQAVMEYPGNLADEVVYRTDFRDTDTRRPDFTEPQSCTLKLLLISLAFCALLFVFYRKVPVLYSISSCLVSAFLGIAGTLLLFMMVFTTHDVTWNNENIIFINPLLLVVAFMSAKPAKHRTGLKRLYLILLCAVLALIVLKAVLPGVFNQDNWSVILPFVPLAAVNLYLVRSGRISVSEGSAARKGKSTK